MTSKYTNKNGEKKLLATLAIFAMVLAVAGAFIVVSSDDSDATVTEGVIPSDVNVTKLTSGTSGITAGIYYVNSAGVSITTVDLSAATSDVIVYLTKGNDVTFTGTINDKIKIYAVTEVDSTGVPMKYIANYYLIPDTAVAVSSDSTSGLLKATSVDSDSSYSAVITTTTSGTTYYYNGYDFGSKLTLTNPTDLITVINNSVTVAVGGNEVSLSAIQGSITVENNSGSMKVYGSFSKGTITMKAGTATTSGITATGSAKVNAFSTAAITSSATISVDCPDADSVYVYGNAASKTTISKTNTDMTVNFVDAASNSVTIQKLDSSGAVLNSVMVNVVGGATVTGSGAISDLSNANITLVSGLFAIKASQSIALGSTVTVSAGTTLYVEKDSTDVDLPLAGIMNIYGTLTSSDEVTVTVAGAAAGAKPGEFRSYAGSIISNKVEVVGQSGTAVAPIIDIATEDKVVSGSAMGDETYYQSQNVIVNGSYDVKNNSTITIYGGFEIPAGAVVTINAGSVISVEGSASIVKIAGKLVLEGDAQFVVDGTAKSVTISGQIETEKVSVLDISAKSAVISDGGVVSSVGSLDGVAITVGAGSKLIIGGDVSISDIYNQGTVTLDGAVLGAAVAIHNTVAGAKVDVKTFTVETAATHTLTIDDDGLVNAKGVEVTADADNSVVLAAYGDGTGYAGLTIVSGVTTIPGVGASPDTYTKEMYVNGEVSFVAVTFSSSATENITIQGKGIVIDGTLDLGKNVKVTISGATTSVLVSGTFDAFEGTLAISAGSVAVTGDLIYKSAIASNINAAQYVVKVSGVDYYNYTTFADAVDSGSKSILLLGTIAVLEDIVVPSGMTVDVGASTFSVGSVENTDVVLSIADGATFSKTASGSVTVYGTLEFANKANNKVAGIVSDVEVSGDKTLIYTNIYTALSGEAADVTITGDVQLAKDLTIGKDSKLTIPLGKSITLDDNVTLTVEGKVVANGLINANAFAEKASATASAIVVTGILESSADMGFADYAIAGAYYNDGTVFTITTIDNAVLSGDEEIIVYGKVTEDITVVLKDDVVLKVADGADVVLNGIELKDDSSVDVLVGGTINSVITTSTATVEIDGEFTILNVSATESVSEYTKVTKIDGEITVVDGILVSDVASAVTESTIVIDTGATLTVPKTKTLVIDDAKSNIVIDGTLLVEGTITITSTEEIPVINGTLDINNTGSSVYALQVIGILDVASTKTLTVGELIVGSLDNIGANGTVIGKVITDSIKAYSGADVSSMDMTGLVSTDFYVNGVLFATVVTTSAAAPMIVNAIDEDELAAIPGVIVKDVEWYKENGLKVTSEKVGKIDAVYATLDTANVDVIVSVEPGIQLELDYRFYIATDGISLPAGTYKVAAKDLNGQKDVKIIIIVDGVETVVTDGQITIDSKMIGKKVIVQASYGSAPGPTPTPVDPSKDFIVSTSVVDDKKVIVSVISLDGGYLVAGTEVEVTFTTLVETVAFGQTVYKPTPVTETITIGDDKPTLENSTYELADILGDKYAVINVISKIGTAGFGNTSLNYKG